MSGAGCAKKIICCNQQEASSFAVGETLDEWFDVPAISEWLEQEFDSGNKLLLEAFDLIDESAGRMQLAKMSLDVLSKQMAEAKLLGKP